MDITFTAVAAALAGAAGLWAISLCAALRLEHRLLFGRPRVLRAAPMGPHASHFDVAVRVPTHPAGRLDGVLARPIRDALGVRGSGARTLVLWLGGRNEDVRWTPVLASWFGPDHAVAAFAYRPRAAEAAVVDDVLATLSWLRDEDRFATSHLVLAGRSIGSAVAMQVAVRLPEPPAALMLLSPMDSVRDLVRTNALLRPAARWMSSPLDSLAVAPAVRCPVLVLLAERDARVPAARSLRLADALRNAGSIVQVHPVPGTTHRTLPRAPAAMEAMATYLEQVPACRTPRRC